MVQNKKIGHYMEMEFDDDGTCIFLEEKSHSEIAVELMLGRQRVALLAGSLSTTTRAVQKMSESVGYPLESFDIISNLHQLENELYQIFNERKKNEYK